MYSVMKLRNYVTWKDFTSTWFLHLSQCELFVQLYFRNCNRNFGIFLWGWTVSPATGGFVLVAKYF